MKFTFLNILCLILFASCSTSRPINSHLSTKYVRSDWPHWSDQDKDCLDTRAEILKQRSLVEVSMNKKGCKVKAGKWEDYYYPEIHILASKVDIDHLIPLKHAHETGASHWSRAQKEKFANDPENLVITNRSYNRQKGAKGIDEWLPLHKDYSCKYITDWIRLKTKYHLKIRPAEKVSIDSLKKDCRF